MSALSRYGTPTVEAPWPDYHMLVSDDINADASRADLGIVVFNNTGGKVRISLLKVDGQTEVVPFLVGGTRFGGVIRRITSLGGAAQPDH